MIKTWTARLVYYLGLTRPRIRLTDKKDEENSG